MAGISRSQILRVDLLTDLAYDNIGMWEVLWRAHTLFPDLGREETVQLARAVASTIVRTGEASLVDRDNPARLSEDLDRQFATYPWAADPPDTKLWLAITDVGSAALEAVDPALLRWVAMLDQGPGQRGGS